MVGYKMTPARAELTSSFSITDTANEVVCPLPNQDGSNCRKRCIGVSHPLFSLGIPVRPLAQAFTALCRFTLALIATRPASLASCG